MAEQNDVKRQYGIAIAVVAILVSVLSYVIYTYAAHEETPASEVAGVNTVGKGTPTAETQRYSQSLQKYNQEHAANAEGTGKSYLSTLSTAETPVAKPGIPPSSRPAATSPPVSLPAPFAYAASPAYGGRMLGTPEKQALAAIVAGWTGGKIQTAGTIEEKTFATSLTAIATSQAAAAASTGSPATAASQVIVVEPYALTYAQLLTEINTDETSLVRAVVPDGMPYAGARLFATGYKRLNNDVDMTFDAMVYQGRSYRVNAKPLDMSTSRTALSGEVTHHYFARIVLPAIANGIGSTGQLFASAGQDAVVTPQGGVVTTSPESPSARNIAGALVGGMGQSAGQVLGAEAAQIPIKTTVVKRGEVIGIQFIGPVTAADDMARAGQAGGAGETPPVAAVATVAAPAQTPRNLVSAPIAPRLPAGITYAPPQAAAGYGNGAL